MGQALALHAIWLMEKDNQDRFHHWLGAIGWRIQIGRLQSFCAGWPGRLK
jgi:hypothetical protein